MSHTDACKLTTNKYGFRVQKRNAGTFRKQPRRSGESMAYSHSHQTLVKTSKIPGVTRRHGSQAGISQGFPEKLEHDHRHAHAETGARTEISVKMEPKDSANSPFIVDDSSTPYRVPALKDPGKRRGYVTMTALEKLNHNLQKIDAVEARQKKLELWTTTVPSSTKSCVTDFNNDETMEDVEDDSWIDHDNIDDYHWIDDDEDRDRRERSQSTPLESGISNLETVSAARFQAFERAFHAIVFGLGYEEISQVIKVINPWLKGQVPFSKGEGLLALRTMEEKGLLRLYDDKIVLPEAYHLVEEESR